MPTRDDRPNSQRHRDPMLTLRQASRLTGVRRKTLRQRIRRGEIAVRVVGSGRSAKLRLTKDALAAAGLLSSPAALQLSRSDAEPRTDLTELVALVREQQTRIAALEEQRFQIAGQLGVALERTRSLEERLHDLSDGPDHARPITEAMTDVEGRVPAGHDGSPAPVHRLVPVATAVGVGMLAIAGEAVRRAGGRASAGNRLVHRLGAAALRRSRQ